MSHSDLPHAEARLNRYRHNVQVAQQAHAEAQSALAKTRRALDDAQLALDAAEDVFNAAVRDTGSPLSNIQPQTIRWLRALPKEVVFGITEAEAAARSTGWSPTSTALRQTLTRMVSMRMLERQGRGDYRLNERALDQLPEAKESEDTETSAEISPLISDADSVQVTEAEAEPRPDHGAQSRDDDWRDDDQAF